MQKGMRCHGAGRGFIRIESLACLSVREGDEGVGKREKGVEWNGSDHEPRVGSGLLKGLFLHKGLLLLPSESGVNARDIRKRVLLGYVCAPCMTIYR